MPFFAPFDCICSAVNASPVSPLATNVFANLSMDFEYRARPDEIRNSSK